MASEWREVELGEVAEIVGGATPDTRKPEYFGGDIPWITPKDLSGYGFRKISRGERMLTIQGLESCGAKLMPEGTVLLTSRAPIGYVAISQNPVCTNQGFKSLILKPKQDPLFYYYLLKHNTETLERHATGSTFKEISTSVVRSIKFRVPEYSEQKRIAGILGALDDKIELNRKMNETLEQMAKTLFKSWFVDFDPVHAKAAGRQPAGMDRETADLFPDSLLDSELRKIPKGWEVCNLGSTLDVLETGRRPKGGVGSYTSGVPSIGAESINGIGVFDYSKTKYIPQEFFEGISSGRVMHYDVLLYKDGGKPGEFKPRVGMFSHDFPFPIFCINEHVFRMRSDKLGQYFLYFLISDQRVLADFANKGGKAAIPGINQPDVKSTLFVNPPREIITAFNRSASHLCDRIIRNALENKSLADLRDTLLPELLSGAVS